jgi:MAF protein
MMKLVLASQSPQRQSLLKKLCIPFETHPADIDESELPGETALELVKRLSLEKAKAVAPDYQDALIIGSDQVATFNGDIIGKPLTEDNAVKQLMAFSGHSVTFLTGLALLNTTTGNAQETIEPVTVHFRSLTEKQIRTYVKQEQPLQCAGSFQVERLGITLFTKVEADDPNTLVGLPLIQLTTFLHNAGLPILDA